MRITRQLETNARNNRRERPWSFAVGVAAAAIGIAGLAVCAALYLSSMPVW
jgi:hypothetical protein